ncbi:phosphomannomutase/phosphoglucomutase, partial [Candidatus Falkowbacteria bacterium CG10_big_fil_rev_8_21_14_0_10_37_6]
MFFVNEKGEFIQADKTLLILAKEFLKREPGAGIVYNAICSRIVPEKIAQWGGRPIISKVGFVNIMETMAKNQGVMGGELSAHYSFRDNGYTDSGFIAWLLLLQLLSEDGRKLSEIVAEFDVYNKTDEINIAMDDEKREATIAKLKNTYDTAQQDELDGLTISFPDWWFNVRKSNTEPLLRLTIETKSKEMTEE